MLLVLKVEQRSEQHQRSTTKGIVRDMKYSEIAATEEHNLVTEALLGAGSTYCTYYLDSQTFQPSTPHYIVETKNKN